MLYHTQYIWSIVILKSTIFISAIKMLVNKLRLHLLRLRFHVKISTCEILPHSHKIQLWCKIFQCHSEKHFFLVYKSLNVRKIRWHLEQNPKGLCDSVGAYICRLSFSPWYRFSDDVFLEYPKNPLNHISTLWTKNSNQADKCSKLNVFWLKDSSLYLLYFNEFLKKCFTVCCLNRDSFIKRIK